jgi:cytochrome P450
MTFKPERFLDRSFSAYEFWPFGEGPRKCLGMPLALIELKLVIATVIQSWNLEVPELNSWLPERRGALVGPPDALKLRILGRCSPVSKQSHSSSAA